jgi:hypothetical protein
MRRKKSDIYYKNISLYVVVDSQHYTIAPICAQQRAENGCFCGVYGCRQL